MKYKLTPATTFAATVVTNNVTKKLTTFHGIEPSGECILKENFCRGKPNIFDKACKIFWRMIYFQRQIGNYYDKVPTVNLQKKNPERQLGVQASWDAVRFLRINDNHWAVCYLKRRSSHLQMKYRLTPDTTFAATVTRNKVPTVFTSFQKQEGTTCKCILQEKFYQGKKNPRLQSGIFRFMQEK